jgi:mannose-6-phosphate isomerase-like protein (cupin superfamily)
MTAERSTTVTDQRNDGVDVRRGESGDLARQHGLDLKLLQPWPGVDTPFEGAWCVLHPGDVTDAHAHREREIFIGMAGRGELVTPTGRHTVAAGDLLTMRPGLEHHVENTGDEDFAYYAIWWDRATATAFLDRPAASS